MEPMATIALRAARKAADVMVRAHERLDELAVEEKSKNDYVSNVDKECEEIIIDALHQAYPDHGIIGEEHGQAYSSDEFNWIIDPLDGTSNYLHGIPHFSISIALKHKHHIEHGVIVNPLLNEEFVASRGKGAQLNGKRIRVRNRTRLEGAFVSSGSLTVWPPAVGCVDRVLPHWILLTSRRDDSTLIGNLGFNLGTSLPALYWCVRLVVLWGTFEEGITLWRKAM